MVETVLVKGEGVDDRAGLQRQQCSLCLCRLVEDGQHARLLSFPDQFNQDVRQWLHSRLAGAGAPGDTAATLRRLTWLHELRMQQYDGASRTLVDVTNNNEVMAGLNCSLGSISISPPATALHPSGTPIKQHGNCSPRVEAQSLLQI